MTSFRTIAASVAPRDARVASPATTLLRALAVLTKARLSGLVLWTTAVGYLIAPRGGTFDVPRFLWTILGTAMAAAAASALNQVMEIRRDAVMHRTATRPLPAGTMSPRTALIFAVLVGVLGTAILLLFVGPLVGWLAAFTITLYVGLYTPMKTRSTLNTLVGAVCGAIPPMMGWAAVTGGLEPGAWALGALLFVWQIPHFLALAWLYRDDYARGGYVMLPAIDREGSMTARIALLTSLLLVPVGLLATIIGLAGWFAAAGAVVLGLLMVHRAVRLVRERDDASARGLFMASLAHLAILLLLIVVDAGPVA